MLKWILVAVLITLLLNRRHLLGDLVKSVKSLPDKFREGKQRAEDPASAAKKIEPR
jgi:hypothetical protein